MYKLFFSLFLLICLSCQGTDNSAEVAKDICTCFGPLVELNDKIQAHLQSNQGAAAERLLPEVQTKEAEGQECAASLIDKYGADAQLDTEKISAKMKEQCPKIHSVIGEALFSN